MALKVYPRARWNARAPHLMVSQDQPAEAFLHHSDDTSPERWDTFAEQAAHMRELQNFHMLTRGWSDIAYAYIVFQPYGKLTRARVFEGRDYHKVPAAQLGHNTGTLPICVVGNFERDGVKRNTRYVIEQLIRKHPSVNTLGGHRDVVSTTCPGDHLYAEIPRIAKAAGVRTYR
jgi:hypothetical protein